MPLGERRQTRGVPRMDEFELAFPAYIVAEFDEDFADQGVDVLLLNNNETGEQGFALYSEPLQAERIRDQEKPGARVVPIPDMPALMELLRTLADDYPEIQYVAADPSNPTT